MDTFVVAAAVLVTWLCLGSQNAGEAKKKKKRVGRSGSALRLAFHSGPIEQETQKLAKALIFM